MTANEMRCAASAMITEGVTGSGAGARADDVQLQTGIPRIRRRTAKIGKAISPIVNRMHL